MTNVFSNDAQNPLDSIKAKYGNDPEKAWEALAHSQAHIAKIETENSDYKTKVATAKTLEEVLAAVQSRTPPHQPPVDQPNTPSVLDENTLKTKVEELFTQRTIAERTAQVSAEVNAALIEKYGDEAKANAAVRAKAHELNLTPEALGEFALRSPKAFYKLFDMSGTATPINTAPSRSSVNPAALKPSGGSTPGTPEYYTNLRREKPSEYWSAKTQNEILAAAMKDPAKFGINI